MIGRPNRGFLLPQQRRIEIRHLKRNEEGYKRDDIFGVLFVTVGWNNDLTFVKGLDATEVLTCCTYSKYGIILV